MENIKFRTLTGIEREIRKAKSFPWKITYNGVVYTKDEYDDEGRCITYGNLRLGMGICIYTNDRYKYGWKDAVVNFEGCYFCRNDFPYVD